MSQIFPLYPWEKIKWRFMRNFNDRWNAPHLNFLFLTNDDIQASCAPTKTAERLRKYHNLFAKCWWPSCVCCRGVEVFLSFFLLFIYRQVCWVGWGEKRWKINWAASAGDGKSGGGQVCYFYVLLLTAHGGSGPNRGQSGVGQGGLAGIPLMVTDNYYGHRYPMDPGYLVLRQGWLRFA